MKNKNKYYFFILFLIAVFVFAVEQKTNAQSSITLPASGSAAANPAGNNVLIYDNGGVSGNYTANVSGWVYLTAQVGQTITIAGSYYTESGFDYFKIFDGNGIGGPLLSNVSGANNWLGSYTGAVGQGLTIQLTSDAFVVSQGLVLLVTYSSTTTLNVPSTGNNSVACGTNTILFDNGGRAANYAANWDGYTVLNCSGTGQLNLRGAFRTETSWDYIYIYNGAGTGGGLLASYHGVGSTAGNSINYTGAVGQTLTVRFYSDGITEYGGFEIAAVYLASCCVAPAITVQPNSPAICTGSTAALSVTASGSATLNYQWQSMASNCATPTNVGANSSSYTTPVLTTGTYYYRCIVTNACGTATSNCGTVTVDANSVLGTISNVGPINFCNPADDWTTSGPVSVSGNTGTIYWQWGSSNAVWNAWGSGTATPPAYCCFQEKVAASDGNADRMRWYVQNGACAATGYSAAVLINNRYNAAPTSLVASASPVCTGTGITLTANFAGNINIFGTVDFYSTSCGGTLLYSITAGNNVNSVTTPSFVPPVGVTNYYARYNPGSASGGCAITGCATTAVTVNAPPTTANAGTDQNLCNVTTATLAGNTPGVGSGTWSVISGTATITTPTSPTSGVTGLVVGASATLRWTISNSPCTASFDNVIITVMSPPTTSNAGPDQSLCNISVATLAGNLPAIGTGSWTVVSGTGTLVTPAVFNSGVTGLVVGSATFRWTIDNPPCFPSSDDITIVVSASPVLGTVSPAGPIDFCDAGGNWSAAGPMTVSGHTGTITWDWGSSNGVWNGPWVTGVNPGYCCFPKKVAAVDGIADRIRWYVTNGSCAATPFSSTILIRNHYNETPTSLTASANPICSGTNINLTANFPTATNISGNVEFYSASCGGALLATVAGNGTTSVSTSVTPPTGTTVYYARYNPGTGTGCTPSPCVSVSVTADAPSVLGTVSPAGPIDFCDAAGNWTSAGPMTVSGHTGTITWDWGSSNGAWNGPWVTGVNPWYFTFPKKVAAVDANADRIRWSVKNGVCAATAYSATILIRNHYNETPSSLTSSINNVCSGTAGTLTANFPTATNISGSVEFFTGSCGGTLIATVAGNGTTSASTGFVAPASSTTYYARYNPGAGSGCVASPCVNITVTILPAAPATPGAIAGATTQCPVAANQVYSISAVTGATSYAWTVPAGWSITAGQGSTAITVTTGAVGQNGNITVTAGNSCGTSAAASLAVTVVAGSSPVAGPDQYICSPTTTATLAAAGTGAWTQISGPAATITTPSSPTSTVTGLVSGTYEFRWTSCGGFYDDVVIVRQ